MTAALVPYSVASDAEFLSPAIVLKDPRARGVQP